MIPWLEPGDPFPSVDEALRSPNGLLAAGADLSPQTLLRAYRKGVFPWYSVGEPILWWSPDPRMVLLPGGVKISRSLRKTLARKDYEVRLDSAFESVVSECAAPRFDQDGTWITPEMSRAYLRLHELGYAHSVETWIDGRLAGGLYGVAIGRAFYGESMFTRVTDASKIALVHLCRYLERRAFAMIDCQMVTRHLATLGASAIPRGEFMARLRTATREGAAPGRWPMEDADGLFRGVG
jgi:leucyl/phenylalanyl-tRNA--protein transferase